MKDIVFLVAPLAAQQQCICNWNRREGNAKLKVAYTLCGMGIPHDTKRDYLQSHQHQEKLNQTSTHHLPVWMKTWGNEHVLQGYFRLLLLISASFYLFGLLLYNASSKDLVIIVSFCPVGKSWQAYALRVSHKLMWHSNAVSHLYVSHSYQSCGNHERLSYIFCCWVDI